MFAVSNIVDNSMPGWLLHFLLVFLLLTALGSIRWPGPLMFTLALMAVAFPAVIIFIFVDKLVGVLFAPLVIVVLASLAWVYIPGLELAKTSLDGRRSVGLGFVFIFPGWWVVCGFVANAIDSLVEIPFLNGDLMWFAIYLPLLIAAGWAVALAVCPTDSMIVASFSVGFALFLVTLINWIPGLIQGDIGAIIPIAMVTASEIVIAFFMPWHSIRNRLQAVPGFRKLGS